MSHTESLISTGAVLWQIALHFWGVIVFLFLWGVVLKFMGRGGRE